MKNKFINIDYYKSVEIFNKAELSGRRLKIGEFNTAQWLQKENINLDILKDFSREYSDLRIFIIGEGVDEGFYIYSKKHETCFKFGTSFSKVK